jgi:predicted acylesterase/phospholipase RssA
MLNLQTKKSWKNYACAYLLLLIPWASLAQPLKPNSNKLLVVSGGGARGAWGVGFLSGLHAQSKTWYRGVYGTSTGSLMAAHLLLQELDKLESAYSNVRQKDIFNQNPFRVNYNDSTGTVTTDLKKFKAVWRLIRGKKTLGESKPLLALIKKLFTYDMYLELLNQKLLLTVAVTNMKTGNVELKNNSTYSADSKKDYDEFCNWIWASANEPLFMSYTPMNGSNYVDGGLREVVPIEQALLYAVDHAIDSIDVVINNSRIPETQNWNINNGGIMNGLERILGIYNMGTVQYNEKYSVLLAKYIAEERKNVVPEKSFSSGQDSGHSVHLTFYCMPDEVAAKYPDELGFVNKPMQKLIEEGKKYAQSKDNCFRIKLGEHAIRNVAYKKR